MGIRQTAVATLLLFSIASAFADDPVTNRGVALDGVYHVHDIDTVSLFNGTLMISVPLGAEFQLDGFSYAIDLMYTGKPFDFTYETRWADVNFRDETHALPRLSPYTNAGLGWRVTMGSLLSAGDPITTCQPGGWASCNAEYQSPDGAKHHFYDSAHGEQVVAGVFYTRATPRICASKSMTRMKKSSSRMV